MRHRAAGRLEAYSQEDDREADSRAQGIYGLNTEV